jgi:hypothetical protein
MARLLLLVAASAGAASPALGGDSPLSSRFAAPPGDPTGQRDSSAALNAELRRLCNEPPPPALSLVSAGLGGIPRDVTLDLQGGVFRLDSPIVVNSSLKCTGVLHIRGGTLYAGQALAAHGTNHSFLVEVLEYWNGLGVSLTDLNFASNGIGGGLRVDTAHHVHVQSSTFLNFATQGIWGSKLLGEGHDLLVNHCRLTECTLPMAQCAEISTKRATAILIEFPDSHFTNSVITCGLKGVVNRGGANNFRGLHIWTSCTGKAGEADGGSSANTTVAFSEESGAKHASPFESFVSIMCK